MIERDCTLQGIYTRIIFVWKYSDIIRVALTHIQVSVVLLIFFLLRSK